MIKKAKGQGQPIQDLDLKKKASIVGQMEDLKGRDSAKCSENEILAQKSSSRKKIGRLIR